MDRSVQPERELDHYMSDGIFDTDWRDEMNAALETGKREIDALKAEVEQQRRLVTMGLEQEMILIDENAKLREALEKTYRIANSWIQDQLQGTKFYTEENEALEPVRKLLGIE